MARYGLWAVVWVIWVAGHSSGPDPDKSRTAVIGADMLRVGADLLKVSADLLRVGADLLNVGADRLKVGADLLKVGDDS